MIPVLCGDATARWVKALNEAAGSTRYTAQADPDSRVAVFTAPCAAQLNALSNLEWAHCTYAGVEQALQDTETPIARLIDPRLSERMAQSALFAALSHCQHSPTYARQQRDCEWQPHEQLSPNQCQVLILGAGELGVASAQRLKQLGFRVATYSRRAKVQPWPHFSHLSAEIIGGADLVINLLPLTPDTHNFVDSAFLAAMKPTAGLVNFARAGVVDYSALVGSLERQQLSYALLDVFETEPLPPTDPLWQHERVVLWPHVSAQTDVGSASRTINTNIQRYLDTGELPDAMVDRMLGY